jgi:hypothetical protein
MFTELVGCGQARYAAAYDGHTGFSHRIIQSHVINLIN